MKRSIRYVLWVMITVIPLIGFILLAYSSDRDKWYHTHDRCRTLVFSDGGTGHGVNPNRDDDDHFTVYLSSEIGETPTLGLKYSESVRIGDKLYHDGDNITVSMLSKDSPFEVYDGRNEVILSGYITFYICRYVPSMYIDTISESMETVNANYYHLTSESASFYAVDEETDAVNGKCVIQGRGNTTWQANEKKPYNISCDSDVSFFGMKAQKKWSLIANFFDGSEMRNWIVLNTADKMGMPVNCECRYTNLYLNGQYAGLYLLCQHIDVSGGNVPITDLGKLNDSLNRYDKDFGTEHIRETDDAAGRHISYYDGGSPDELTGGYLLEFMDGTPMDEGYFSTDRSTVVIESPRYPTRKEVEYISGYINEIEDLIYDTDDDSYLTYIDPDTWPEMYLLQEFFANEDSDRYSFYMYKDRDSDILIGGPAWDFDISMGVSRKERIWDSCRSDWIKSQYEMFKDSDTDHPGWLYGLYYGHESFKESVINRYYDNMLSVLRQELETDIPDMYERISTAAYMDHVLYPEELRPDHENGFEYEYAYICDWLKARMEFCSDNFSKETLNDPAM